MEGISKVRRFGLRVLASVLVVAAVVIAVLLSSLRDGVPDPSGAVELGQEPRIEPDYTSCVVPPNIAPLNFRILEDGQDFLVAVSSDKGQGFRLRCRDGNCRIPLNSWRDLLAASRGGTLFFDVFAQRRDETWVRFERVANTVAPEPIDSYIVYRRLVPNKARADIRGIYQRDLESFQKSAIITTRDGTIHCFNCHTFHQHDPNRFLLHVRGEYAGMVLVTDGEIRRINTKQDPMFRPLAYASWHPDGQHIAATCNRFIGHTPADARTFYFEALEKRGDLLVYDVEKNKISTTEAVFGHEYIETHPCWSHDGKSIYYCRAKDRPIVTPKDWENNDFDLMRVPYDPGTDTWGIPETVKAFSELGLSCAFPRPSPCGRYVLHILCDKTTFPIHQKSADIYLLDLESGEDKRLDVVCSDLAESYPRWSSNGRWFTFLSNREDGMSALPYLAYFDEEGQTHKPLVVPQEDPEYYGTFTDTYNTLETVKSRVNIDTFKLAQAIQEQAIEAEFPNPPNVDAYTGPTKVLTSDY
jgi:hypothetical protein